MKKRMQNLETFKTKANFLIANRDCAGYSLNLQFCHNIIYFSNSWGPGHPPAERGPDTPDRPGKGYPYP